MSKKMKCDNCKKEEAVRKTPNGLFNLCEDCYYGLFEDAQISEKELKLTEHQGI